MFASTSPRNGSWLAPLVAAAGGVIFGLALARCLFELDPLRLNAFGTWAGALLLAAMGLVAGVAVSLCARRLNAAVFPTSPWASLALFLPLISLLSPDINLLRSSTLLVGALALLVLLVFATSTGHDEQYGGANNLPHTPDFARRNRPERSEPPRPRLQYLLSPSLFLFLFFLYFRTLAPAVGQADTFEFQVGVARLGIAHGSGYPLLMLIGRLFTLLPVGGTLAFRANLTSAFFGALAGVGVERVTRRLGASPLIALLAGLAFGVSPTLWSRAVEIEAYTLNAAFVSAILYLALSFFDRDIDNSRTVIPRLRITNYQLRLSLLAYLFGLSLTNHLTTLLLAPACLAAVLLGIIARRQTGTGGLGDSVPSVPRPSSPAPFFFRGFVLLAFLLGLSIYLYLPLRWPAVNHGEGLSIAGFINIITGNEARGAFQWRLPFQDLGRYPIVWSKIAGEYGWAGLGLALLGVISLLRPPRPTASSSPQAQTSSQHSPTTKYQLPIARYGVLITFALGYLGYLYFALAFNVPDPDFSAFFIPLHLITAVLMGLGVQWLINILAQWQPKRLASTRAFAHNGSPTPPHPHSEAPLWGTPTLTFSPTHPHTHTPTPAIFLLLSAFCLLPLSSIWRTFPLVDRSSNWAGQRAGELMLNQLLAEHAAILADSEKIAPLGYLQIAEGRRPDLDIIVLPDETSYRAALDERLAAGQVVYLGRYLPGLGSAYSLRSVGPLAEVSTAPFTAASLAVQPALTQPGVTGISLIGYAPSGGGSTLSAAAPGELNVSLAWHAQIAPADNLLVNLRLVNDIGQAAWQSAGSVPVSGLYPTNAWRAGEIISDFYSLPIAPSLAPGIYQLQVALLPPFAPAPVSAWTPVAPVTILPPAQAPTPPHMLRDQFGPNWLLGYDSPEAVAPGSSFAVTLYWLRTSQSDAVPGPSAQSVSTDKKSIAAWPAGAIVPVVYHLTAPASGGDIRMVVDGGVPAACGWLAMPARDCPLPAIRLAGQAAAQGAANYDNQLLLNQARLATPTVAPGSSVTVNLEWQALRSISADYTVFVHLLGPDGLVHGQIDRWPVSGTRATSSWAPGESIVDPYVIQLPADAPTGAYQVEIGLYLLSTGQRLAVLNTDGVAVDDRLLLPGLAVRP